MGDDNWRWQVLWVVGCLEQAVDGGGSYRSLIVEHVTYLSSDRAPPLLLPTSLASFSRSQCAAIAWAIVAVEGNSSATKREESCRERGRVDVHAKGAEQEERDGRRVWDLQGHDREGHGGRGWQARHYHRGWGGEDARWWVVVMTRASDVGTDFERRCQCGWG